MKRTSDNQDALQFEEFDLNDLRYYLHLTPEQKLTYLEKLTKSLREIIPPHAQEMWKKLKATGF